MPNRLAQAQSLYLRKHADNPIDWWSWCDEALETAKRENKPIFLSIGYSSCHWCTVMEGEAFSDPAIAEYMNAHFLPIKVDREERPDLDSIYMQTLQAMTGQGGWPLNVFLSPDDRLPFYGGTYFPLEPKYGKPGFLQVLQALRRFYDTETQKLTAVKSEILQHLQQSAQLQSNTDLNADLLKLGLQYSAGILSSHGMGPSFPMIPYAATALHGARFHFSDARYDAASACQQRGQALALGGIYDHVGGGFHRYTVDPTWTVPHFEKMLYDNGLILEYLANLWATGVQEPAFTRSIEGTVQWLRREMTAPQGYFYAAQDADSFVNPSAAEPEEGAFYVWTYSELEQHLTPDELSELSEQFTVTPEGNFEHKNVLQRDEPGALSDRLEGALSKLFALRYGAAATALTPVPPARNSQEAKTTPWAGRIPPVTDTKMIASWNSLMISGLARAAVVWQRSDYLELSVHAAQFLLQQQWVNQRFHRLNYEGQPHIIAQSEDYALFIKALLDLHQATLGLKSPASLPQSQFWLEQAIRVQEEFDEFLWSPELGGYYNTDARADLVVRERSYDDNAIPSANGTAADNLVRLFLLTEVLDYFDRAEQTLQAFSSIMAQQPQVCPSLFAALDRFRNAMLIRSSAAQIVRLSTQYLPTAVCRIEADLADEIDDRADRPIGYVCQGLSCKAPAQSVEQLQQQIQQGLTRL